MINQLKWDSELLNRKIGELGIRTESPLQIESAIKKAKDDGYKYIICKLKKHHTVQSIHLESLGFYLSDIGVTWEAKIDKFSFKCASKNSSLINNIKKATNKDIPTLKKMVKSLFLESRFYNDPFFSKKEADNIYMKWIENSVKCEVADIVYHIPDKGIISCKKTTANKGDIILIGIKKRIRGKSLGTALVEQAMKWFKIQCFDYVCVRTQLKNIDAMNFYNKLGFYIKEYDLVMAKIF